MKARLFKVYRLLLLLLYFSMPLIWTMRGEREGELGILIWIAAPSFFWGMICLLETKKLLDYWRDEKRLNRLMSRAEKKFPGITKELEE